MNNNSDFRILILDDEEYACKYLKSLIDDTIKKYLDEDVVNVKYVTSFNSFKEIITKDNPNLIFVDYQMPVINGIECVKYIRDYYNNFADRLKKPIIILVTAHSEYAYDAYQNDVFDYILKPCTNERIDKLLNKLYNDNLLEIKKDDFIYIQNKGINSKLSIDKIIYIKADMKYLTVYSEANEYIISGTLSDLEKKFVQLVRVHRGYLVNKNYINKFFSRDGHWYLSIKNNDVVIPVSRRHKNLLDGNIDF